MQLVNSSLLRKGLLKKVRSKALAHTSFDIFLSQILLRRNGTVIIKFWDSVTSRFAMSLKQTVRQQLKDYSLLIKQLSESIAYIGMH